MGHVLNGLIKPETMKTHRATWWVYLGGERIRRTSKMTGSWGYDVTCSCGWDSRTGGATRGSVEGDLWDHRYAEQSARDEGLPNSDPGTWPEDVLRDYISRHRENER